MVSLTLIEQGALGQIVVMLDYWILVLAVLALLYLLYRLPRLVKRQVAVTYILLMALLVFWSLRHMAEDMLGEGMMPALVIFSLAANLFIMGAVLYLLYQYLQLEDVDQVLARLDLEATTEAEQEQRPELDYDDLTPGKTYLIEEQGGEHGLTLFRDAVTTSPGLCFSYKNPNRLRERHSLENTAIVWVSGNNQLNQNINTMSPGNLDVMLETIIDFIEEQKQNDQGEIVIIDGFELLIYNNPFTGVMSFVEQLMNRYGDDDDVTFIFAVERDGIYDEQRDLLEREIDEIREVTNHGISVRTPGAADHPDEEQN